VTSLLYSNSLYEVFTKDLNDVSDMDLDLHPMVV